MADPEQGGRIAYYTADPRGVIPLGRFRIPRSVARAIRRRGAGDRILLDAAFAEVVAGCAEGRADGAWLTDELADAYCRLHSAGVAHSVECWRAGRLVGGLFGVALGGLFTSESMFHRATDAGNAVLVATAAHLMRRSFVLWDIQMASAHTRRFGAEEISAEEYARRLRRALVLARRFAPET
jgi:leucyl/phenylalanyl-tRNA--protein transferase